jgi:UDP-3-O-acyl N-acetylglucosamine deacetylase
MLSRPQRTIRRSTEVRGFGLFGGADVTLRFLPAPEHHGIAFQRVDLADQPRIPALIQYVQPRPRRTVIGRGSATVEMIEHVMGALAGLWIDNCLVQLDAVEPPALDGSSDGFTAALLDAGITPQRALRRVCRIDFSETLTSPSRNGSIRLVPSTDERLSLTFDLDYRDAPIGRQSCRLDCTPDSFVRDLSFARTFVLWFEAEALRSKGLGRRATPDNVLLFGPHGPIDGVLRAPNECARHKALDCIGDFALLGCDIVGQIHAEQSGHDLNHDVVRRLDRILREEPQRAAG